MEPLKFNKGSMLLEIIVSVAIFAVIAIPILTLGLGALKGTSDTENRLKAQLLAQEGVEAARSIASVDWDDLSVGAHGLADTNGYWQWSGASDTANGYTRQITVTQVNADTRDVSVVITWAAGQNISAKTRLTHWKELNLSQTLNADFNAGTTLDTAIQSIGDGAVQLNANKTSGTFTSSVLDTGSGTATLRYLSWTATLLGATGIVQFQLKTASTSGGLGSAVWVGPDGTNATFYTTAGTAIITDPGASGTRWVQYQISFSGNGTDRPAVEDVTVQYRS